MGDVAHVQVAHDNQHADVGDAYGGLVRRAGQARVRGGAAHGKLQVVEETHGAGIRALGHVVDVAVECRDSEFHL